MFSRGDTFLMGPIDEYHLHVIVSRPNLSGEVVLAPMTTLRPRTTDRLLILDVGDHPFIRHPSAIGCSFAQIASVHQLDHLAATGRILRREPMNPAMVERIAATLLESDFTENGVKHFLKEQQHP